LRYSIKHNLPYTHPVYNLAQEARYGNTLTPVKNTHRKPRREYNLWAHIQQACIIAGEGCRILLQTSPAYAVKPCWRRGRPAVKDPSQVPMPGRSDGRCPDCVRDIPSTTVTIWCRYSDEASDLWRMSQRRPPPQHKRRLHAIHGKLTTEAARYMQHMITKH